MTKRRMSQELRRMESVKGWDGRQEGWEVCKELEGGGVGEGVTFLRVERR